MKLAQIFRSDAPGHLLVQFHPLSKGSWRELVLIADPRHFPSTLVARIARKIKLLLKEIHKAESDRTGFDDIENEVITPRSNCDRSDHAPHSAQRGILISFIRRSGVTEAELAWNYVDPAIVTAEEIDWLIFQLNASMNDSATTDRTLFVTSQN